MSAATKPRPATYQDVIDAPENMVAEIIDDELFLSPRPAGRHSAAASALGGLLSGPLQFGNGGPGGWTFLVEPELHLVARSKPLVPDIAGYRRERGISVDVPYFEVAPDWVCEILSPSNAARDRAKKMPRYAQARIPHAWLVDPILKTLEVFRLDGATWRLMVTFEGPEKVRAEPFDAVELDLGLLWM